MAPDTTSLTVKVASGSPYQLESVQVRKASTALLQHIKSDAKRKETATSTRNLLATSDNSDDDTQSNQSEPIWLVLTTKKHIVDQKKLKPGKIPLPHSFHHPTSSTICLITADPQRSFKDIIAHPSFPTALASQITRVIGISKLLARYKSFESRRQLHGEHDVFLADDRIITRLPKSLGKIFYSGSKRPIPVNLLAHKTKTITPKPGATLKDPSQKSIAAPLQFTKEIQAAVSSAQVHLSPSTTTSIRIGSSNLKPDQISENIEAVVDGMVTKFVSKGWRNIRAIHIKGPNTMALPIWLANELWQEEADVLEDEEAKAALALVSQKGRKRKGREGEETVVPEKKAKQVKRIEEGEMSKEMQERRAKLRQQKKEANDAIEEDIVREKSAKVVDRHSENVAAKTKEALAVEATA
ncbi:hypothetical protein MMC19_004676 [Ptychographa xylographoides]|nr:hypothetical protein [Ptychographa xylographoides]